MPVLLHAGSDDFLLAASDSGSLQVYKGAAEAVVFQHELHPGTKIIGLEVLKVHMTESFLLCSVTPAKVFIHEVQCSNWEVQELFSVSNPLIAEAQRDATGKVSKFTLLCSPNASSLALLTSNGCCALYSLDYEVVKPTLFGRRFEADKFVPRALKPLVCLSRHDIKALLGHSNFGQVSLEWQLQQAKPIPRHSYMTQERAQQLHRPAARGAYLWWRGSNRVTLYSLTSIDVSATAEQEEAAPVDAAEAANDSLCATYTFPMNITTSACSVSGSMVAFGLSDGSVTVLDTQLGSYRAVLPRLPDFKPPSALGFWCSENEETVLAACETSMYLVNLADKTLRWVHRKVPLRVHGILHIIGGALMLLQCTNTEFPGQKAAEAPLSISRDASMVPQIQFLEEDDLMGKPRLAQLSRLCWYDVRQQKLILELDMPPYWTLQAPPSNNTLQTYHRGLCATCVTTEPEPPSGSGAADDGAEAAHAASAASQTSQASKALKAKGKASSVASEAAAATPAPPPPSATTVHLFHYKDMARRLEPMLPEQSSFNLYAEMSADVLGSGQPGGEAVAGQASTSQRHGTTQASRSGRSIGAWRGGWSSCCGVLLQRLALYRPGNLLNRAFRFPFALKIAQRIGLALVVAAAEDACT